MSLLALIGLIASVAGATKDLVDIAKELHDMGFKPGDIIPDEHVKRIAAAMLTVPNQDEIDWDINHESGGG